MGRDFKMKKEPFFHHFKSAFSCQKSSQARERAFETTHFCKALTKGLLNEVSFFIFCLNYTY